MTDQFHRVSARIKPNREILEGSKVARVDDELDIERMGCVLEQIALERRRQERKGMEHRARGQAHWRSCADPLLPTQRKLAILGEEYGEVAKALNEEWVGNPSNLREELIHVAAVATAWAESLTPIGGFGNAFGRLALPAVERGAHDGADPSDPDAAGLREWLQ